MTDNINLVWLRRDLRLHDHAALFSALQKSCDVQPIFIFDTEILKRFSEPNDRRLTFIAETLCHMHEQLKKKKGGLLLLHGTPTQIIPKLAHTLKSEYVCAAEDYEPETRKRDKHVGEKLGGIMLSLIKDHVIAAPTEITREGQAYKVYTPYAKIWREKAIPDKSTTYECDDKERYADFADVVKQAQVAGLKVIDSDAGAKDILKAIGYNHVPDEIWPVDNAQERLHKFVKQKVNHYGTARDYMAEDGTSQLSPYIRFGLVSIRECYQKAAEANNAHTWIGELIWRDFYAMILYHFPESATTEWNPRYREKIEWSNNPKHLQAWKEGRTGYPVVDAAMRQLLEMGWMHNRARMIVASFLTKHLLIDWREGEEHFAQYLMDYDLASNVGGWQWAASTGTDAQPYFRIFNPYLQSEKFDSDGAYIHRYVPELKYLKGKDIHHPLPLAIPKNYTGPIVEHEEARKIALAKYKKL